MRLFSLSYQYVAIYAPPFEARRANRCTANDVALRRHRRRCCARADRATRAAALEGGPRKPGTTPSVARHRDGLDRDCLVIAGHAGFLVDRLTFFDGIAKNSEGGGGLLRVCPGSFE